MDFKTYPRKSQYKKRPLRIPNFDSFNSAYFTGGNVQFSLEGQINHYHCYHKNSLALRWSTEANWPLLPWLLVAIFLSSRSHCCASILSLLELLLKSKQLLTVKSWFNNLMCNYLSLSPLTQNYSLSNTQRKLKDAL